MAATRPLNRTELATIQQTIGEVLDRDVLTALSQRKLNALGLPLAYIDRNQRYRFVNKAFLDWTRKRLEEVLAEIRIGPHPVREVVHAVVDVDETGLHLSSSSSDARSP